MKCPKCKSSMTYTRQRPAQKIDYELVCRSCAQVVPVEEAQNYNEQKAQDDYNQDAKEQKTEEGNDE